MYSVPVSQLYALWFPCTNNTKGNGPVPSGIHTIPFIGIDVSSKPADKYE